jgi:hypothetical protein
VNSNNSVVNRIYFHFDFENPGASRTENQALSPVRVWPQTEACRAQVGHLTGASHREQHKSHQVKPYLPHNSKLRFVVFVLSTYRCRSCVVRKTRRSFWIASSLLSTMTDDLPPERAAEEQTGASTPAVLAVASQPFRKGALPIDVPVQ